MKSLPRFLVAMVLAVSLSACAALNTMRNPVSRTALVEIESAYGLVLSGAVAYRNSCARKTIPPSCRPIVVRLQGADRVAQASITALRNFVRNNPELNAPALVQAAWQAIEDFKAIAAASGLPQT